MNTNDVLNGWKNLGSSLKMIQQKISSILKKSSLTFHNQSFKVNPLKSASFDYDNAIPSLKYDNVYYELF